MENSQAKETYPLKNYFQLLLLQRTQDASDTFFKVSTSRFSEYEALSSLEVNVDFLFATVNIYCAAPSIKLAISTYCDQTSYKERKVREERTHPNFTSPFLEAGSWPAREL